MSWDILIFDCPDTAKTIDDLPEDFAAPQLGRRADLIEAIRTAVPTADFSDPEWGVTDDAGCTIEVNIGRDDPVRSIMLHVRRGDGVIGLIAAMLRQLGARAYDCQTGDFLDMGRGAESFGAWREYRNRVVTEDD